MSSDKNSIDGNPNSAVIPGKKKSLTMGELKKQLADLGLKTTGKKQILLDRLKEHHESNQKWDDSFEIFQKKALAQ